GPYKHNELAKMYRKDLHVKTFKRKVKRILESEGLYKPESYFLFPNQVKLIFKKMGVPDCFLEEYMSLEKKGLI
ncbi:MAG: hypothetical protein ACRC3B_07870, partial [Bacteroidia bacterium]